MERGKIQLYIYLVLTFYTFYIFKFFILGEEIDTERVCNCDGL